MLHRNLRGEEIRRRRRRRKSEIVAELELARRFSTSPANSVIWSCVYRARGFPKVQTFISSGQVQQGDFVTDIISFKDDFSLLV